MPRVVRTCQVSKRGITFGAENAGLGDTTVVAKLSQVRIVPFCGQLPFQVRQSREVGAAEHFLVPNREYCRAATST